MKKLFLLYLLSGTFLGLLAQETDSSLQFLEQQLNELSDSADLSEAYCNLGLAYYQKNQFREAKEAYIHSMRYLDSTYQGQKWAETLQILGDTYQRLGNFPEALQVYRRAEPYFRVEGGANDLAALNGKMGYAYSMQGDFGKAMDHYENALGLYENAGKLDSTGLVAIYISIGILHSRKGNYQDALGFYQKSESWYKALGDRDKLLFVYNNMSGAYLQQGHSPRALDYLHKALELSEEIGHKIGQASANSNIGMLYNSQESYEKALPYLQKSKTLATEMGDRSHLGQVASNLGSAYQGLGDREQAMAYFQESLKIRTEIGDRQGIARANLVLGTMYREAGKYDLAKTHTEQALEISAKIGEQVGLSKAYHALGSLALDENQHNDAVGWCLKGEQLATHIHAQDAVEENCFCLAKAYEKLGNYQKALKYHKQYLAARDSLINVARTQEITRLEMQYDFDREKEVMVLAQEQKEAVITEKLARQRIMGFALLGGMVAGLAILALLWRGYRQKQKANRLLESQKATVQRALDDRENLLREIHHRVKNNLQVVSSLLSLQSRTIKDPAALGAIQEGRNRVRAMALIHQNLYQEENLVGVDLPQYIEKLTDSLVSSYRVDTGRIHIEREIAPISLDVDTLIPLGLILNELISNALKYAFQGRKEGKIEVRILEKDPGLEILVRDNGVGIPKDFRLETTETMGFKLVRAFADKMKARIEIGKGEGTCVRIVVTR